jgi:hypothetical protein
MVIPSVTIQDSCKASLGSHHNLHLQNPSKYSRQKLVAGEKC